jgi:hypothetical protein
MLGCQRLQPDRCLPHGLRLREEAPVAIRPLIELVLARRSSELRAALAQLMTKQLAGTQVRVASWGKPWSLSPTLTPGESAEAGEKSSGAAGSPSHWWPVRFRQPFESVRDWLAQQ